MATILETSIEIDAPVGDVWKIFTDFSSYPQWNPFIIELQGNSAPGNILNITLQPPGAKKMVFKPLVLKNDVEKEFRWKGKLLVPGIFDGEHYFLLERIDAGKTRFVHGEKFTGLLVPFVKGMLRNTQKGFEAMNVALKSKAEQTA